MRLTLVLEQHFQRTPDGAIHALSIDSGFWANFLHVFSGVDVVARVADVAQPSAGFSRCDQPELAFIGVSEFQRPFAFLKVFPRVFVALWRAVGSAEILFMRVPGTLGLGTAMISLIRGRVYVLEIVGDPWDSLAPGTIDSASRPIFRVVAAVALKVAARAARGVLYVTQRTLQLRYPARWSAQTVGCSSIRVSADQIVGVTDERRARALACARGDRAWRIGFVGSFNVMYKAPDVHLRALKMLRDRGWNIEMDMVGDGNHRHEMEALAAELGIEDAVNFLGQIPAGQPVFDVMDRVDVFWMASRTEGLPRALIEAMARGCPAVGSRVGGIPELLEPQWLVPAGSDAALAGVTETLLSDGERLMRVAERNVAVARDYELSALTERRLSFYKAMIAQAEITR